MSNEKGRNDN
jgi:hypothetical protein